MKMSKYFILTVMSSLLLIGCTDENLDKDSDDIKDDSSQTEGQKPDVNVPSEVSVEASFAAVTKSSLEDGALVWNPGDKISLVVPSEYSDPMILELSSSITESSASATFTTDAWPNDKSASDFAGDAVLFYPSTVNYTDAGLGFTLPASQKALAGDFAPGLMLSHASIVLKNMGGKIAVPENTRTVFTNVCGLLALSLPESVGSVKSVTITSNNDSAPLAGVPKFFIQSYDAATGEVYFRPGAEWTSPEFSVTLAPAEGLMTPGNVYYAVVYPGTHAGGLDLTLENAAGEIIRLPNSTPVTITHSKINELSLITEFKISSETLFTKREGGEFTIDLVSKNSWTAQAPSWIDLEMTSGGAGEYKFKFSIAEPDESELGQWDMRAGRIVIADEETALTLTVYNGYGTLLRGKLWADGNVGEPGTFVSSPEEVGGLYQYNSKVAITSDPAADVSGLDWPGQKDMPGVFEWAEENNPCPTGWRVPTIDELKALVGGLDGTEVKADWQWPDQTDFAPRGLMIGNTVADALSARKADMKGCIFIPASGFRDCSTGDIENDGGWGWLYGCRAYIQSCTRCGEGNTWDRWVLQIDEQNTAAANWAEVSSNYSAHPVRCVRDLPQAE